MSQHILALGSVSVDDINAATASSSSPDNVVSLNTKEAITQHRLAIPPNSIHSLVFWIKAHEISTVYDPMELAGWAPLLTRNQDYNQQDAATVVEFRIVANNDDDDAISLSALHTSLLLAGFKATRERKDGNVRILTAQRKTWTSTTSQSISLPTRGGNGVVVSVNDDDEDLMDEDDLLNDTTLGAPTMEPRSMQAGDDCSGRKACDNCSCGRAAIEAIGGSATNGTASKPALTKEELVHKTSACGNCPKGDAFRCASCPFLGKPAFKAGQEHLVLDLMDDL